MNVSLVLNRRKKTRRRVLPLFAGLLALAVLTAPASAAPQRYDLDPEHMTIAFLVDHIGFAKTFGIFREAEGSFTFDETVPAVSDVRIVVQTDSVWTNHERRDDHLRNSDFLDVDDYPEMSFVGLSAEQTGERTGIIRGELTLLGQTRPLDLELVWNKSGEYPFGDRHHAIGISARGLVKRSDYGMTYAVANGLVGDEVELIIEFEAIRQD